MSVSKLVEGVDNAYLTPKDASSTEDSSQGPVPDITDDMIPALPPGLAYSRLKSTAEILEDLNKSPLFMTSLEENEDIEALRALAYEGTPYEVACGFKEHGNECFTSKNWKDAKEFYNKAINILIDKFQKVLRGEMETLKSKEKKRELQVLEACLINRAACHLELQNYRTCILDCGSALQINSKNIKAYYRSSKAFLALDKITESKDACKRGLEVAPENSALHSVAAAIESRSTIVAAKRQQKLELVKRQNLEIATLSTALRARNITLRKTTKPPEMEDAQIALVPDPIDPTSSLCFPTVLLYPLRLESDFIKAFNETQSISEHLSYILPLPWDHLGEYFNTGVVCFMETTTAGLIKVGLKVPILKALATENVEIVDELVKIYVLPKASATAWTVDFKKKKALEKTP